MATSSSVSRFPLPDLKNLPDDIREAILSVQEKAGFVPNVFLALVAVTIISRSALERFPVSFSISASW